MRVAATLEFVGKVIIVAECVEPVEGPCIQGAIPGGTLYVDKVPRGTVVGIGPIDYDKILDYSGKTVDYVVNSTHIDAILDL